MKNKSQIQDQIKELIGLYDHVLRLKCETVFENAPRALMQVKALSELKALYWVLGEKRPLFRCEKE